MFNREIISQPDLTELHEGEAVNKWICDSIASSEVMEIGLCIYIHVYWSSHVGRRYTLYMNTTTHRYIIANIPAFVIGSGSWCQQTGVGPPHFREREEFSAHLIV